ncbi:MAG: RnfABCDGE type electron transport complex subunit D [Oscillospiraceae bacterium]|nr:RnfABCDGE type electron transport complex subunit D [Oscillospiraceae bacterium]
MDSENKKSLLSISASPHIRTGEDTRSIMLDVLIALVPALAVGAYMFGLRAILNTVLSVAGCLFFEWGYRKLLKKPASVGDLSAAVTGVLLAYTLPVSIPWWIILIGDGFAIVLVKQLFGGIGKNFMNPALAARAFLFSWPVAMTKWVAPLSYPSFFSVSTADAVTSATPLASMANGAVPGNMTLLQAFLGQVGGSMGEISAFALLLGGVYLLIRKIITLRIPLAFLLTVALLTFLFPQGNPRLSWMLWQLCSGGVMLGAIFMATDYSTSPVNPKAQIVFGIGCGALTVFIRYFGSYVEGVSYAILIMNATVWLLDKAFPRKRFGYVKPKKEAA